jgi:hypothetical protein
VTIIEHNGQTSAMRAIDDDGGEFSISHDSFPCGQTVASRAEISSLDIQE